MDNNAKTVLKSEIKLRLGCTDYMADVTAGCAIDALSSAGIGTYDTRTHVAIPRSTSDRDYARYLQARAENERIKRILND